uniref:Alpha-1,6-mannosyl-glycoprotein 6-beta-N-acetylglucosaminyltransferase n=1 Tax=Mycena chlorophos TaxID=658473 RepID=A0ABQ0L466_MYCCL|nr:predicted protein [Mycena chlorophos]
MLAVRRRRWPTLLLGFCAIAYLVVRLREGPQDGPAYSYEPGQHPLDDPYAVLAEIPEPPPAVVLSQQQQQPQQKHKEPAPPPVQAEEQAPLVPKPASRIDLAKLPSSLYPPEAIGWNEDHWKKPSEADYSRMYKCLQADDCVSAPNRRKVVLVASMYFRHGLGGEVGGEEIWAVSVAEAMEKSSYTVIHVETLAQLVEKYQLFPQLVKIAILGDGEVFDCWKDTKNCLQSDENPNGIPGYKLISFCFWTWPRHPLGPRWVISPEPYNEIKTPGEMRSDNRYIGYSIENTCNATKYIPANERPSDPSHAWLLAKLIAYFYPERDFVWSKKMLDEIAVEAGVVYTMASHHSPHPPTPEDVEKAALYLPDESHYINHYFLRQAEWLEQLAQARMVIGIGNPVNSPTPWNALCLGVPFINVILSWDHAHPNDRTWWRTQHPIAALLDAPLPSRIQSSVLCPRA